MPDIRHLIQVAAPPDALFPLVASGEGFKRWWAEDVEQGAAGLVTLGFFGRKTVYALRPETMFRPSRASWLCDSGDEWKDTHLVFAIRRKDGETILEFTHANWREASQYFTLCNTTWGELMYRLKAAAEGKQPGPLFLKDALAY